jgi:hypothetical protein
VSIGGTACLGYARTCAGRCDSTKVRSASQSRVVHPSRLSVSSLGRIQEVVVVGAERLYQSEERIHISVSEDSSQRKVTRTLIRLEEASSTSTSPSVVSEDVQLGSLTNSNSPKKDASILRCCNGSNVRDCRFR